MKKLYFKNCYREFRELDCDASTEENVLAGIQAFLDEHHYKSYYTRKWQQNGRWIYDVGSHTEFFVWADEDDMKNEGLI